MLTGKNFVVAGVSRIGLRVVRALARQNASVACIVMPEDDGRLVAQLQDGVEVIDGRSCDLADLLRRSNMETRTCLVAVSDNDLDNVRCCVAARQIAPDLPVVLRAFDPALADQLENGLNVRRAYSVSALSAPAFVASTFGVSVLETLRLGDGEVLVCELNVIDNGPLVGLTEREVEQKFGCAVIARNGKRADRQSKDAADKIEASDTLIVGGIFSSIWELGLRLRAGTLAAESRRRNKPRATKRSNPLTATYLPTVAAALCLILLVSVVVFKIFLHLSLVDAIYFVITTATTTGYGDINLMGAPGWLKIFANIVMLSGGALLGVLFSYMAACATAERLGDVMSRRAERMSGHIIVVGLGNVGYRVSSQFLEYGVPVVALEVMPDARFVETLRRRTPVIFGDARLAETLMRASVDRASAFVACSNDDMANIQACLHAKQINPGLRTVARVFDDALAERLTDALQIDSALSPSKIAAGAFVGAASGDRAMRTIMLGDEDLGCCRLTVPREVSRSEMLARSSEGLQLLAYRPKDGSPTSTRDLPETFSAGDELIVCGPEPVLRKYVV